MYMVLRDQRATAHKHVLFRVRSHIQVPMKTQLELRALRAELARTKLLVQSEMSKRPNSGAEFPLEARVRRASIEESYSGQDATPPPPPLNSPEPLRR